MLLKNLRKNGEKKSNTKVDNQIKKAEEAGGERILLYDHKHIWYKSGFDISCCDIIYPIS